MLRTSDHLQRAEEYARVVARHVGALVRLGDVAQVRDGAEDERAQAWVQGRTAVTLEISKQPGHNVLATSQRVREALDALRGDLPAALAVSVLGDRTRTVRASVEHLQWTLAGTLVLAVLVVLACMPHPRAALVPALMIPLALLGTCIVMRALSYALDNISLLAMTIVIGFVVDDAIVMLEHILSHRERGLGPREAALRGAREITATVVAMSLALVAALLPISLMGGLVGRLLREFAVTASVAVGVSALLTLCITPALCRHLLAGAAPGRAAAAWAWVRARQARLLRWTLQHPSSVLALGAASLAAGAGLYALAPKAFFPKQDTGMVFAVVEARTHIAPEAMARRLHAVAERVQRDPAVERVLAYVEGGLGAHLGRLVIELRQREQRAEPVEAVMRRLRALGDGQVEATAHYQARQDVQLETRLAKAQYQYLLRDADADELAAWAPRVLEAMKRDPLFDDVGSDAAPFIPQLRVQLDRDRMTALGITPAAVDDTLFDAFGPRQIGSVDSQTGSHRVVMALAPGDRLGEQALARLRVDAGTGDAATLVPLSAFSRLEPGSGPMSVFHDGQLPATALSFNLAPGRSLDEALGAMAQLLETLHAPPGLSGSFQGTARALEASLASQPGLIALAVLAIYIVLGLLYESVLHPLAILQSAPSAGVGALVALWLGGYEFTLIGLIAVLWLVGMAMKNGILIVDFARAAERDHGLAPDAAVLVACAERLRPILMTTFAALLGALPLMLGGAGSELRRPLGVAIVGGLVFSQVLALLVTPALYVSLRRAVPFRAWGRGSG